MRTGQPFVAANARRLRRVAAVIGGEVLSAARLDQFYARTHFRATGLLFDASFNIDFFAVFLAFIIFAIAEVFAAGTRPRRRSGADGLTDAMAIRLKLDHSAARPPLRRRLTLLSGLE